MPQILRRARLTCALGVTTAAFAAAGAPSTASAWEVHNLTCHDVVFDIPNVVTGWILGPQRGAGCAIQQDDPPPVLDCNDRSPTSGCPYTVEPGTVRRIDVNVATRDFACSVSLIDGGKVVIQARDRSWLEGGRLPDELQCRSWFEPDDTSRVLDVEPPQVGARDVPVEFLVTADFQYSGHQCPGDPSGTRCGSEDDEDEDGFTDWVENDTVAAEMRRLMVGTDRRGILVAGDLVHTESNHEFEYDKVKAAYGRDQRHLFEGLGNHDRSNEGNGPPYAYVLDHVHRRDRTSAVTNVGSRGTPHYSWDWRDVHFVQLNLAGSDEQLLALRFLEDDLARFVQDKTRPVVIVQHYGWDGLSRRPDWWTLQERQALWDAIEDHNVVAIFTGHRHLNEKDRDYDSYFFCDPRGVTDPADESVACRGPGKRIPTYISGASRDGVFLDVDIDTAGRVTTYRHGADHDGFGSTVLESRQYPDAGPPAVRLRAFYKGFDGRQGEARDGWMPDVPEDIDVVATISDPNLSGADLWRKDRNDAGFTKVETAEIDTNVQVPDALTLVDADPSRDRPEVDTEYVLNGWDHDGFAFTSNTAQLALRIDATSPTLTVATKPNIATTGWSKEPVEVSWKASDGAGSGIESVQVCEKLPGQTTSVCHPAPADSSTVVAASGVTEVTLTAVDRVGRTTTQTVDVGIDRIAPTIGEATLNRAPNAAGWYREPVTATFPCADEGGSGTKDVSAGPVDNDERALTATCVDKAGNRSEEGSTAVLRVDSKPPTGSLKSATPAASRFGWHPGDVTAVFECQDERSGVASPAEPTEQTSEEGRHVPVNVVCRDVAGNATRVGATFDVDRTPPTARLADVAPEANAAGWWNEDVRVSATCEDGLSGVVAPSASDVVTDEGADLRAAPTCEDRAGHTAQAVLAPVRIDRTAPDASLLGGPPEGGFTNDDSAAFEVRAADELSGIAGQRCQADDAQEAECSQTAEATGLDDGRHRMALRVTDRAGNETKVERTWKVDRTAPVLRTTLTFDGTDEPYEPGTPTTRDVRISTTCEDPVRNEVASGLASGSPPADLVLTEETPVGGVAPVRRCADTAGNETTEAAGPVRIDRTAPDTAITSGPSGVFAPPSTTNDPTPTFTFGSNEEGSTFECRTDTGAWTSCTSPHTTTHLADGQHTFEVRAIDGAGNLDPTPASKPFTVKPRCSLLSVSGRIGQTPLTVCLLEVRDT